MPWQSVFFAKRRRIPTPVCARARNDNAFCNVPYFGDSGDSNPGEASRLRGLLRSDPRRCEALKKRFAFWCPGFESGKGGARGGEARLESESIAPAKIPAQMGGYFCCGNWLILLHWGYDKERGELEGGGPATN